MSVGVPRLYVEFGFGQSIGTAKDDIDWTQVTEYVRAADSVSFSRGRAIVGEAPTAGTLSLSLANDDGRFTPGLTSGPYGTGVRTRIPVRITASVDTDGDGVGVPSDYGPEYSDDYGGDLGATIYDLWYGFVTDITWNPGADVRVTVQAADILAQSGKITCRPWMSGRILAHAPAAYWPLTDSAGSATAASGLPGGAGRACVQLGDPSAYLDLGVTSDLSPDQETVAALTPVSQWVELFLYSSGGVTLAGSGDAALSAWVRPASRTLTCGVASLLSAAADAPISVAITTSGALQVTETKTGVSYSGVYGPADTIPLDTWTHVYVERDHSQVGSFAARFRVWINGVEVALASGGGSLSAVTATGCDVFIGYLFGDPFDGQIGHVAVFDTLAGDARAELLADNGSGAPTAADRFNELPRVTNAPTSLATWMTPDSTSLTGVSAQTSDTKTLLELAQEVATVQRGNVIAARDGVMRLVSSRSRITDTVSLTLDAATDVLSFDGAFGVDDADAVDEVTVTARPSGATFLGNRDGYDSVESSALDVWTDSTVHAQAVADGVANFPYDVAKSPQLSVSMQWAAFAGFAGDVLALELGDLVRVTGLPASAPATSVDLIVESIDHDIDSSDWVVTFDTSPGELAAGGVVATSGSLSTVATTLVVRP